MNNIVYDTADTTRVLGSNPFEFNTYVTGMIYPSSTVEWRPNAVILVPITTYHYGLLASPIIHFPINAPLLFTNPDCLFRETLDEIKRLSPTGDNVPAKVIIVGPVSFHVELQIRNAGFSTMRIDGYDVISTAGEALEFRYYIPPDSKEGLDNIMIVPLDGETGSVYAAYYSAHMGVPILFSYHDYLPEVTKQKLMKYRDKNVFIISDDSEISDHVLDEIKAIVTGKVDRIGGTTPYECAVNFAKYYSPEGNFGWNINSRDGWAFCFGNPTDQLYCLAACIFAHLGKHSPLLYVNVDRVTETTKDYVLSLNPKEKMPPSPPFMHGFILGEFEDITHRAQVELEKVLIVRAGK